MVIASSLRIWLLLLLPIFVATGSPCAGDDLFADGFGLESAGSAADSKPSDSNDLITNIYVIQPNHWLWLRRIALDDPDFEPQDAPPESHPFELYRKSAREWYEACGLKIGKGESFIYTVPNTQLIARLSPENVENLKAMHKTLDAWRKGRTDEWHHEAVRARAAARD